MDDPFRPDDFTAERAKREHEADRTSLYYPQEWHEQPFKTSFIQGSFQQSAVVKQPQFSETAGTLIEAFKKTAQRWRLNESEQIVLLGYKDGRGFGKGLLSGQIRQSPSQDLKDRIGYLLAISVGLGALFREAVKPELDWLALPRKELGGESARQRMLLGHMRDLLAVHHLVRRERNLA
jgi:hypothetical protein